jgi:hypothetical protein
MTSALLDLSLMRASGSASPEDEQCDIAARRAAIRERARARREQAQRLHEQTDALADASKELMRDYLRNLSAQARKNLLSRSAFARLVARLETMPVIEQAKGIIMAQSHCDEACAFDLLRQASQRCNVPVRVLAAQLVAKTAQPPPTAQAAQPSHPPPPSCSPPASRLASTGGAGGTRG